MSSSDGAVLGITQIFGTEPIYLGFNIVMLAEGFQASEQAAFNAACADFVALLNVTPPFSDPGRGFNVFRVNVTSTQSGADDPVSATPPGTGAVVATYFDATFGAYGIRRLLVCDDGLALSVAIAQLPEMSVTVVVVNSPIYGGSGGAVAVYSLHVDASEIAVHEMGHMFGLADEYSETAGAHPGPEPTEPNVTLNFLALKWNALLTVGVGLPTKSNPDCATPDYGASPVPWGTVGAFEGGDYYHCGCYRPEINCKMRELYVGFCAVCREVIAAQLTSSGPGPGFGVLIENVDRTQLTRATGSLRIESQLGALTTCHLEVVDLDSYATAYRPEIDELLAIAGPPNIGQRRFFNGMILGVEDQPLGAPGVGTVTAVRGVSNWRAATKRRVSKTFPAGGSLKEHVNYLTVTYLADFNIYIDPLMADGPEMGAIVYDQVTVEEAMNYLADLSGWVYRLRPATPNDVVEMFPIGDWVYPISLSAANANIIGPVTWGRTREVYLNRVILRYGTGLVAQTDAFVGDGTTRVFPLTGPQSAPVGPTVRYYGGTASRIPVPDAFVGDGATVTFLLSKPISYEHGTWVYYFAPGGPDEGVAELVGLPGEGRAWYVDTSINHLVRDPGVAGISNPPGVNVKFTYEFLTFGVAEGCGLPGASLPWYIDGNNNLIRDPVIPSISNPPEAGVAFDYTYNIQYPATLVVEDPVDILPPPVGHNVWEDIFERSDIFNPADALVEGQAILRKHLPTPRRVTLRTRAMPSLIPGDTVQLLDVPERTLPVGPYLVTAVTIEAVEDQQLMMTVELLEGDTNQGSWIDFWREAFGLASRSGGVVSGSQLPPPVAGGGGAPGAPVTAVQFNRGGTFGGDAAFTYNEATHCLAVGANSSIDVALAESCLALGEDCHIG